MAKFRVTLTDEERCGLRKMVSSGKGAARTLLQGCIVLQADASLDGMRYTDEAIAEALRVRLSTIHRVRQQCVEESFEAARKPRRPRKRPDKVTITGEVEQRLLAWACREPPRPARRWPRRQTHAAPQELRCERGRWKTAECRAPWHRLRTQRGPRPVESLQPVVRRASIREQAIIRSLGQGAAERPVSFLGRLCSRGHACLDVQSWGG